MKRKMAYIGFSYLFGLFVASFFAVKINLLLLVLLLALGAILFLFLKEKRKYLLIITIPIILSISQNIAYTKCVYNEAVKLNDKNMSFKGEVVDFSQKEGDRLTIIAKGKLGDINTTILVYTDMKEIDYYDKIEFKGTFQKISDTVSYSGESINKSKGIFLNCFDAKNVVLKNQFSIKKYILHYRDYLFNRINEILPNDEGGFISAMLCGDKSELSGKTKLSLYRTGIGHIFCVSGTHLVIISGILIMILNAFKVRKKRQFFFVFAFVIAFSVFSGMSVSVIRASIMLVIYMSAYLFKREPDILSTLGLVGLLICITNPYAIRSYSFILSFSGALGLGYLAPLVNKHIKFKGKFCSLKNSIMSLVTLSVFMFPISMFCFNEISLISPLSNLILIPICTLALTLAVIIAVFGGVYFISNPILVVAGTLVKIVIWLAGLMNKIPLSYISTGSDYLKIITIAIILVIVLMSIKHKSVRAIILSVIVGIMVIVGGLASYKYFASKRVNITLLSDKESTSLLLIKGEKSVIINLYGEEHFLYTLESLIEKNGVSEIESIIIKNNNADNLSLVYKENLYVPIKKIYSISDEEMGKNTINILSGSKLYLGDATITLLDNDSFYIENDDKTVEVVSDESSITKDSNIKLCYKSKKLVTPSETKDYSNEKDSMITVNI